MGGSRNRGLDDTDFDMGIGTQIQTQEKHKSERNLLKHNHIREAVKNVLADFAR